MNLTGSYICCPVGWSFEANVKPGFPVSNFLWSVDYFYDISVLIGLSNAKFNLFFASDYIVSSNNTYLIITLPPTGYKER